MAYIELTDDEIDDLDRFFSEDGVRSSAAGRLRYVGERGAVVEQVGQVRRGRVDAPPGRCFRRHRRARRVNHACCTVHSPKQTEFAGEQAASSSPPWIQNGISVLCQWCFAGKWHGRVMRIGLSLAAAAAAAATD